MTAEEAQAVAEVLSHADGGCHVCAFDLADRMKEKFPEHDWNKLVGWAGGWGTRVED